MSGQRKMSWLYSMGDGNLINTRLLRLIRECNCQEDSQLMKCMLPYSNAFDFDFRTIVGSDSECCLFQVVAGMDVVRAIGQIPTDKDDKLGPWDACS